MNSSPDFLGINKQPALTINTVGAQFLAKKFYSQSDTPSGGEKRKDMRSSPHISKESVSNEATA